ncbi:aspartate carbamoyltransferase regulatory subunit [Lachnospiraceae bacterium MD1]|jgi:aspartate carbamoyltransferase regulatory subunit|uniref:Aspartate carbamoyltransferase regulatory subunit n=1 Tax=Variimorphobacter saccharofermentans TaxID=2755051 RepID=A0A839K2J5_9FIRM|nr:aspartate carbamoyltransferase regulatory subunit [Variimorphobacter saccharofermentans]MBB2182911.1 aspartate carbamoyltransferase regulatory subunit [Variimorphobacter saccharofermentans]
MLNIGVLNQGIVIDHIKVGGAMKIYSYLDLENKDVSVAIIKNAKSNKMGKKDIIKIEGTLDDLDLDILGAIDHRITIDIIENGVIIEKKNPTLPDKVTNILKCKNPRCITSVEPGISHTFKLTDRANGVYRCTYCEQAFDRR